MKEVKPEDVEALIEIFDQSDWSELRIAAADFQLYLSKDAAQRDRYRGAAPGAQPAAAAAVTPRSASGIALLHATAPSSEVVIPEGMVAVLAPSLGTFYQAPKPGAQPFVAIGQRVEPDTELCIIEVMKLFTAVRAGVAGIVRRMLVADGQMVEYDQPLFLIEPAD
ncbi:MAG: acetyl-CoA carboxylase biotin carboxyl carrier protein [Proteobacteria bacterium]|nr:acetyl-CoA carboxylase biotin carboxyl carrier protein [Pseudomonadota bacterium]